jgi:uroporphyrin-III C-methyltransferase/precorrin-2 dehydrogenase/sirohydrochlorin ferrochelatase
MKHFPIFLDIEDRKVLIVGGGEAAAQKARLIGKTPAHLHIVASDICSELSTLEATIHLRPFSPADLDDAAIVYVATGDIHEERWVSDLARQRGIAVNVVDQPHLCSFLTPAIVDRDPVVVAIGTEGAAPMLAQGIKSRLEAILPPGLGVLARKARQYRPVIAARLRAGSARRAFWGSFFFGTLRDRFLSGGDAAFSTCVETEISELEVADRGPGRVALVGAGPGDPELLTLKAQRLLQSADVIVHDRLVGPEILEYARRDAERICVGKTPGLISPSQGEINRLLINHAAKGSDVVRLKGGDPYIFARGAEEQAALEEAGVEVEVVPGITAAAGCAAAIKLPLTRRGENRSLSVLTAMGESGPAEHDWSHLARAGTTFALYMGVGTAERTQIQLLDAGIDPETPVVIVENGTLAGQRSASTNLSALSETIMAKGIHGPAIIYVGLAPVAGTRVQDLNAETPPAPSAPHSHNDKQILELQA